MANVYTKTTDPTIGRSGGPTGGKEYRMYIDGNVLPITPSKITYNHVNRVETVYLADESFMVLPHPDGPQTFSFDFRIPMYAEGNHFIQSKSSGQALYPFELPDSTPSHQFWSDLLWELKRDKKKTELTIIRHTSDQSMCEPVYLTDWSYVEDAEKGNDFIFSVTFTDYWDQENQEIEGTVLHHLVREQNVRSWTPT